MPTPAPTPAQIVARKVRAMAVMVVMVVMAVMVEMVVMAAARLPEQVG